MNDLTLATPTFLFSAISLLLLAYTNRFLAYASLVRGLHAKYKSEPNSLLIPQILNLQKRLFLTKSMQILGIGSLLICVLTMFFIYINLQEIAQWCFGIALLMLIVSLAISIWEIWISSNALNLQLKDLEDFSNR